MSRKSYKQLQTELRVILDRFESSEHEDLDDLMKDYDKGMQLIKALEEYLQTAELQIRKVKPRK